MIVDAAGAARAAFERSFDVCVIGAGPAGMTLARSLADRGLAVALMEAGGFDITAESQEVYEGENVGQDYFPLDVSRLRFLGGTSNHWGGWCRALDALDFDAKPWNPMSGWPIAKADLDPYNAAADALVGIPSARAHPDEPADGPGELRLVRFRWSEPPTNFRDRFHRDLAREQRVTLGLRANLTDLRLSPDRRSVEAAVFRGYDPSDPGFSVRARAYALCCGGIENARLLLNFTSQVPAGIGNGAGLVGRCFAEHPHFVLADVIFRKPMPRYTFLSPTVRFLEANEVLNFAMRIEGTGMSGPMVDHASCADPFVLRLAEQVADVAPGCAPGAVGKPAFDGHLRIAHEQAVNPDSRVFLVAATDRFGMRRAALDWRLTSLDVRTQRAALMAAARLIAELDIGRARIREWVMNDPVAWPAVGLDEVGGNHHMGTTRMADDPGRGVVDRNCRVHGVENLYGAGSSVFPNGGHANPTYTILQLALRLGDHLGAALAP